jgi:hypothetical protein
MGGGIDKMDSNNQFEYQKLIETHISWLTTYGRNYLSTIGSAVRILESDFLGDSKLSKDEKRQFFKMLNDVVEKHFELIKQTIEERKRFFESLPKGTAGLTDLE